MGHTNETQISHSSRTNEANITKFHKLSQASHSQAQSLKLMQGTIQGFEHALETIDASLEPMQTVKETKKQVDKLTEITKSTNEFLLEQMDALRIELTSELMDFQKKRYKELEDKLKLVNLLPKNY